MFTYQNSHENKSTPASSKGIRNHAADERSAKHSSEETRLKSCSDVRLVADEIPL
jgi:hypothetical protein